MKTASFSPIAVTFETIDILIKQEHGGDLIALYMTYCGITHWQQTYQPKASNLFMMKRLNWGEKKFYRAQKKLKELGLITPVIKHDVEGRIVGNYIQINHIVTENTSVLPEPPKTRSPVDEGTSALNVQLSALNKQIVAVHQAYLEVFEPKRYTLTPKRRDLIKRRLKDCGLEDVLSAVRGCATDPWQCGDNERGYVADLEHILKSVEMVEKWSVFENKPSRKGMVY